MIKDTCSDPDSRFRMVQEHVLQACKDPVSASFGLQTDQQAHRARTLPLILTLTSTPTPTPTPTPPPTPTPTRGGGRPSRACSSRSTCATAT
jgi:hypothetical protein